MRNLVTYCREWLRLHWATAIIIVAVLLAATGVALAAPTAALTYTVGPGNVPTLTWACGGDATTAAASGDWSGNKTLSGTQTLPAIQDTANYSITCSSPADTTASLTWTAPTQNTDGSALTDLAGFRVYSGNSASSLDQLTQLADATQRTYQATGLAPGTKYFALSAYTTAGTESALSNVGSKTIMAAQSVSRAVKLTLPKGPLLTVATTAYNVKLTVHGWRLAKAIGTVELGTQCQTDFQLSGGYYRVERKDVKFEGKPVPVAVARCA